MHGRRSTVIQLALVCLLIAGLGLAGCGGPKQAAGSPDQPGAAGAAPTSAPEPTAEPTATPEPASSEEGEETEVTGALDNLIKLAPLHITSAFVVTTSDGDTTTSRFEADFDAKGNQHLFLYAGDDQATELYVVDGTMYMGIDGGQFMSIGELEADDSFAFIGTYGGAYLLVYNDLANARKVGSESVNGFQTDKYEVKLNLASLGLGGLAAEAQGAEFNYEGYVWLEQGSGALVRSRVDWSSKAADQENADTWHAEFDATKGTVESIDAPENVLSLEG